MTTRDSKPEDTIVTLTVDTEAINEKNKNSCVWFTDNQDDPKENPGDPEHYISTVNLGKSVIWTGFSKNGNDIIVIVLVQKKKDGKGGADILQEITIGDPKGNKDVIALVVDKYVYGDETYDITFIINNDCKKVFTLDPRLRINQINN